MTTIKSFSDLQQSKKLAEILPLESADMKILPFNEREYRIVPINDIAVCGREDEIYAWSLAALLDVLPKEINIEEQCYAPCLFPVQDKWLLKLWYNSNYTITSPIAIFSDNPVDACYEVILKLHELKML